MAGTRPILFPQETQVLTVNQETDARTALTRGMGEYLRSLQTVSFGTPARALTFQEVFDTWPQSEDKIKFPSAAVLGRGPGRYDASSFTPGGEQVVDGGTVVKLAELVQTMEVIVWSADPVQRMHSMMLLERALSPVEFMYGLRLELPHYFNLHATYEPTGMEYDDTPADALRRYRRTHVHIMGSVPVLRQARIPPGRVRFKLVVGDTEIAAFDFAN
jgi:hypothetical protein